MKLKKIITNWKIIILIIFLTLSILSIQPNPFAKGVVITSIEQNSTAAKQGLEPGEIIKKINDQEIKNINDYNKAIKKIKNRVDITTNKNRYIFLTKTLNITVKNIELTKIKKGLDLSGGTRVLLKPKQTITTQQLINLIDILKTRLDIYGLSDLTIREARDLSGNKYVLIEITGATKQEVKELIAKQGKFEAKIGNETVFRGEKEDITYVCKNDGTCSGIRNCIPSKPYFCKFEFQVSLSPQAAKRHAEITKKIPINTTDTRYLEKKLDFYLDNKLVDSLFISADLKGQEATKVLVSGPGFGSTKEQAIKNALKNMNKLQTILTVGSLPVDLEIVKMDTISPILGTNFIKNVLKTTILAITAVALVIFIRYKNIKILIPIIINLISEIIIILGFASLIKWNLDIASIAGILASVGTGVDDQIVITDEVLSKERIYNWKERLKRAFFIILAAYLTTLAAMFPLFWAGAGLIRGFAATTIIGISIGVFITRPAFASMIEILLKE